MEHQQWHKLLIRNKPPSVAKSSLSTRFQHKKVYTVYKLAYSTGLASSEYHVFPALKQNLGGLRFKDNHTVETTDTDAYINREHKTSLQNTINIYHGTERKSVGQQYD
jgi:hypothetical protein